ncbi:hypothetical protein BCR39DRAFT_558977 [Naematelia encephala]|uniref:Uncharacterized protein n=1 Tax=Naematelia encephala TaxID=71784 RepID=A0A1Y2B4I7_9TREE|nr:hypothetical protein BCR39DRAFT_558977 [Naematelia encephala]
MDYNSINFIRPQESSQGNFYSMRSGPMISTSHLRGTPSQQPSLSAQPPPTNHTLTCYSHPPRLRRRVLHGHGMEQIASSEPTSRWQSSDHHSWVYYQQHYQQHYQQQIPSNQASQDRMSQAHPESSYRQSPYQASEYPESCPQADIPDPNGANRFNQYPEQDQTSAALQSIPQSSGDLTDFACQQQAEGEVPMDYQVGQEPPFQSSQFHESWYQDASSSGQNLESEAQQAGLDHWIQPDQVTHASNSLNPNPFWEASSQYSDTRTGQRLQAQPLQDQYAIGTLPMQAPQRLLTVEQGIPQEFLPPVSLELSTWPPRNLPTFAQHGNSSSLSSVEQALHYDSPLVRTDHWNTRMDGPSRSDTGIKEDDPAQPSSYMFSEDVLPRFLGSGEDSTSSLGGDWQQGSRRWADNRALEVSGQGRQSKLRLTKTSMVHPTGPPPRRPGRRAALETALSTVIGQPRTRGRKIRERGDSSLSTRGQAAEKTLYRLTIHAPHARAWVKRSA